jgi:hypothetical protein
VVVTVAVVVKAVPKLVVVAVVVVIDVDVVDDRSAHTSHEPSTASVKIKHSEQSRQSAKIK